MRATTTLFLLQLLLLSIVHTSFSTTTSSGATTTRALETTVTVPTVDGVRCNRKSVIIDVLLLVQSAIDSGDNTLVQVRAPCIELNITGGTGLDAMMSGPGTAALGISGRFVGVGEKGVMGLDDWLRFDFSNPQQLKGMQFDTLQGSTQNKLGAHFYYPDGERRTPIKLDASLIDGVWERRVYPFLANLTSSYAFGIIAGLSSTQSVHADYSAHGISPLFVQFEADAPPPHEIIPLESNDDGGAAGGPAEDGFPTLLVVGVAIGACGCVAFCISCAVLNSKIKKAKEAQAAASVVDFNPFNDRDTVFREEDEEEGGAAGGGGATAASSESHSMREDFSDVAAVPDIRLLEANLAAESAAEKLTKKERKAAANKLGLSIRQDAGDDEEDDDFQVAVEVDVSTPAKRAAHMDALKSPKKKHSPRGGGKKKAHISQSGPYQPPRRHSVHSPRGHKNSPRKHKKSKATVTQASPLLAQQQQQQQQAAAAPTAVNAAELDQLAAMGIDVDDASWLASLPEPAPAAASSPKAATFDDLALPTADDLDAAFGDIALDTLEKIASHRGDDPPALVTDGEFAVAGEASTAGVADEFDMGELDFTTEVAGLDTDEAPPPAAAAAADTQSTAAATDTAEATADAEASAPPPAAAAAAAAAEEDDFGLSMLAGLDDGGGGGDADTGTGGGNDFEFNVDDMLSGFDELNDVLKIGQDDEPEDGKKGPADLQDVLLSDPGDNSSRFRFMNARPPSLHEGEFSAIDEEQVQALTLKRKKQEDALPEE